MTPNKLVLAAVTLAAASGLISCASPSGNSAATTSATVTPSPSYATPTGRRDAAMAYDPASRRLIMFGGGTAYNALNDTWAWDGKGWTQLHPSTVPSGNSPSMVYDPGTRQLLLFTSNQQGNNVWQWTGNDWKQFANYPPRACSKTGCSPAAVLAPDQFGPVVYDAAMSQVVMQAGLETWLFDGSSWTKQTTLDQTASNCFCLVYDSSARQLLSLAITGGKYGSAVNHTLLLDAGRWTTLPVTTPIATQFLMADDPATGAVVMLALNQSRTGPSSTQAMYTWDGNAWRAVTNSLPPILIGSSLAYDGARKQLVFFGGLDVYGAGVSDTWIWDGHTWQKRP